MNVVKKYDIKNKYNIKIYIGNYDRKEFYSQMGEFFADRFYRKKLPYLINDVDKIWYLIYERDNFLGFFGIKICADNTLISDIYIDEKYNKEPIFKYMAQYLVDLYREEQLKVLTKISEEEMVWLNLGFKKIGSRGKYSIMIRDGHK